MDCASLLHSFSFRHCPSSSPTSSSVPQVFRCPPASPWEFSRGVSPRGGAWLRRCGASCSACCACVRAVCACAAGAACVLAHARSCCHTPFIINGAVSGVQRHLQPTAGGDCLRSTSSVGHSSSSFAPEDAANGTGDQATSTTFHYGQLSGSEESERGLLRVLKTPPAGGV